MRVTIRPGRDADAAGFIALIRACWGEYPGLIFDLDGELPELHALASHYAKAGGALWAAEDNARLIGMIATRPIATDPPGWEICRVYLDRAQRGSGLAARLLAIAEDHALTAGATRLVLWSDTRFTRAHRFYAKAGYLRHGPLRALHDRSHSLEFGYAKPRDGIASLDAAAAASAVAPLAALAGATTAAGWEAIARAVAGGRATLLVGWQGAALAGAAVLALDRAGAAAHRAEVTDIVVGAPFRRRGLGRALLAAAIATAEQAGCVLLTLTAPGASPGTSPGTSPGAALAEAVGLAEAGRIPRFLGPDRDGVIFHACLPRACLPRPAAGYPRNAPPAAPAGP